VFCFIVLGLAAFRKGHYLMFWFGIIFPVLWIIGALMAPTVRPRSRATGRDAERAIGALALHAIG
jgi:hypothetical protein